MVYVSDKRVFVNADGKVVAEDSPDVASLLIGAGGELSDEDAAKYGLSKAKAQAKAEHAPPENKAEAMPKASGSGLTINRAGAEKK